MPSHKTLGSYARFLWAGLLKHPQTGSIVPSQRFLLDAMIAPIPKDYTGQVIELGTGNGCLALRLAVKCPAARIVACEINPVLAQDARANLDRAGINGQVQIQSVSAQTLLAEMATSLGERPGYVVSGLPLGNFGRKTVLGLVQLVREVLPERGIFVQVQHLLWDRKHIRAVFHNLRTVPILLNFPPAFVYYAQK